jgi:hypothetical protein
MITPRIVKSGQHSYYPEERSDKRKIRDIDSTLKNEGKDVEKVFKDHVPLGKKLQPFRL